MQFYSQYGEDRDLWSFFKGQPTGVCVEVGGFDGVTFSNTLCFEENGWKAVIVEPMPDFVDIIRTRRPSATLFACAAGSRAGQVKLTLARGIEVLSTATAEPKHLERIRRAGGIIEEVTVPMRTLDELLIEAGFSSVDFITIDVEGGELEVLAGFDLGRWRPRVVILENDLKNKFGKRSLALHDAMLRRGYHWYRNTGCNEWYLPGSEKSILTRRKRLGNFLRAIGLRSRTPVRQVLEFTGLRFFEQRMRHKFRARHSDGSKT